MSLKITNDFLFRYIFSHPDNQDLLLNLVNAVLTDAEAKPIASLKVQNPVNLRSADWLKDTVLDIRATDGQGSVYDVEIQLWEESAYSERSLFYWAQIFAGQLEKAQDYGQLNPVICINLLGFVLFPESMKRHTCFQLRERQNPQIVLSDHLMLHFIEMEKKDSDKLEAWIRLFHILEEGHVMSKDDIVLIKSNPDFERVKEAFQESLQDREARELALSREKYRRDQLSRENRARREGKLEGKLEAARAMVAKGLSIAAAAEITGLTEEQISGN